MKLISLSQNLGLTTRIIAGLAVIGSATVMVNSILQKPAAAPLATQPGAKISPERPETTASPNLEVRPVRLAGEAESKVVRAAAAPVPIEPRSDLQFVQQPRPERAAPPVYRRPQPIYTSPPIQRFPERRAERAIRDHEAHSAGYAGSLGL